MEGARAEDECSGDSAVGVSCLTEVDPDTLDPGMAARTNATVVQWKAAAARRHEQAESTWFAPEATRHEGHDGKEQPAQTTPLPPVVPSSQSSLPSCSILNGVPMPFVPEEVRKAYVMVDRITELFAGMNAALLARLCDLRTGPGIQKVLVDLVERGLRWNAIGACVRHLG